MSILGVFIFIVIVTNMYDLYKKKSLPRKIFQQNKINSDELNRVFYKSFIPCIYDMRALSEAYEKGLKMLNEVQACRFFSYPKTYIIDENDDLIVNNVNLGPAKECSLLQFGWDVGFGYTTTYEPRYSLILKHFNGCMVVEDYKYNFSFCPFPGNVEKEKDTDELVKCFKATKKELYENKDNITGVSENAFKKFAYVLPEKYKNLYNDFQKNNYTTEEMQNKLKELYKESINEYDRVESDKNDNYEKIKSEQAIASKERVGEFWESAGPWGVLHLNRASNKNVSDEEWNKDFKDNERYIGSGFRNLDLAEKYSGEDKRIIKEYSLE